MREELGHNAQPERWISTYRLMLGARNEAACGMAAVFEGNRQ